MEAVNEDVVTYRLYFKEPNPDEQFLCAALSTFTQFADSVTEGYIWQSEKFELKLNTSSQPPHLVGRSHFGDCIADEWLITYLLYELTRRHTDLCVTVEDSDGYFLLIEAAHALPRWLNEQTAKNRIFIHRGELHIIPQPRHPGEVGRLPTGVPDVEVSLQLLYGDFPTEAQPDVQACIKKKLSAYPGEIRKSRHITHCVLPLPAAHVLSVNPALIAPAVQAFYQRDPLQLRVCKKMRFFPPDAPSVCTAVKFSRLLYAQLCQQQFKPLPGSGWKMSVNSSKSSAYDLGVKLSHGLEMLCAQAGLKSDDPETPDFNGGIEWERYFECLKKRDYFHGEIEGSRRYRELLASAKTFFTSSVAHETKEPESWRKTAGAEIRKILETVPCEEERFRAAEKQLPAADSDSWMEITTEQLDDLLTEYSAQPGLRASSGGQSGEQQLDEMVSGMNKFVHAMSGHEGVEIPSGGAAGNVAFNPDFFSDALASVLNLGGKESSEGDESLLSDDDTDDDDDLGDIDASVSESEAAMMKSYMASMDEELAATELAKSFTRANHGDGGEGEKRAETTDQVKDGAKLAPVDIDLNLVKNLLASYSSQQGLAGPVSNILHSMGVSIPPDEEDGSKSD